MGHTEEGIERSIPTLQFNMGCKKLLRGLRHTGSVRDYVKEFSSLLLDIRDMSEEDKLFNFMVGRADPEILGASIKIRR